MAAKKDDTQSKVLPSGIPSGIQVYRHNARLPPTVQTQWEYGDWPALKAITLEAAEQQEARAFLAAIIAVAHHQDGTQAEAQPYLQKAVEWGMNKRAISQIFAAGAYNSLGRAALLAGTTENALNYFGKSLEAGIPGTDYQLITPVRANHQGTQMGISVSIPYQAEAEEPPQLEDNSNKPYTEQLMAILGSFAHRLVQYGQELIVDGVEVFRENDPFLPGKIAMGLAYWVTEHPPGSAITKQRCQHFRQIMHSVDDQNIESWGIHFYLKALQILNEASLITECFSFQELVELRKRLDWRSFVKETDYTLIKKPNNFYGIAYSIAYTRYQLGWDNLGHSQNLLEKELDHYEVVSGGEGFPDETNGKGRYDRYSFLLIAEIAYRFYEAGLPLTKRMKKWLKASADYVLFNANDRGDGFQWGRSIGAYGDSAFLEILTAAKVHNLLNEQELAVACYFSKKITGKFLTFWFDKRRGSVNIWNDGKATDAYRGKHRILGENLSLLHHHLYSQRVWEQFPGYLNDQTLFEQYESWIERMPDVKVTFFKKAECCYSVTTIRCDGDIVNIPLVNGERHYNQMAYQPVPFFTAKVGAIPDYFKPVLRTIIRLSDGGEYIAYPCYETVDVQGKKQCFRLSFSASHLTRLNEALPEKAIQCRHSTVYTVAAGRLTGKEVWGFKGNVSVDSVTLFFMMPEKLGRAETADFTEDRKAEASKRIKVWTNEEEEVSNPVLVEPEVDGCEQVYSVYKFEFSPSNCENFSLNWEFRF
ncbi:tetratricopeptide repeat protein [Halomonas sp. THAF12]|uniref:tetratricopeptide repeat protein n=1 Tax=Halomonas sp. B23F22_10 TaxID=3459515 RepID=UPI00373EC401